MTTIAFDTIDLISQLATVRDRESLRLVSRVLESQLTVLQAQVVQLQQVQGALEERAKTLEGAATTKRG
jgi:hypothetical protein